ncbi:MAG: hypothetical protein CME69_10130 [Halobacteriovorax sp.]|nr:hypothetical protein [Halobacteriovorax sp.]
MIKKIAFLTFISLLAIAESYTPPKVDQPTWNGAKTEVKKDSYAVDQDASKGINTDSVPSLEDPESKERKPSSGEEEKPRFWDFQKVK